MKYLILALVLAACGGEDPPHAAPICEAPTRPAAGTVCSFANEPATHQCNPGYDYVYRCTASTSRPRPECQDSLTCDPSVWCCPSL